MYIREATIKDLEVIVDFNLKLAIETESKTLDREIVVKGVEKVIKKEIDGMYFVCEMDGKIVGQTMMLFEWSDWRNGNFVWIQSVYIDEEYRKSGIFRNFYAKVKEYCDSREDCVGLRLYVDKNNHKAQSVYKKLGMKPNNYDMYELLK